MLKAREIFLFGAVSSVQAPSSFTQFLAGNAEFLDAARSATKRKCKTGYFNIINNECLRN